MSQPPSDQTVKTLEPASDIGPTQARKTLGFVIGLGWIVLNAYLLLGNFCQLVQPLSVHSIAVVGLLNIGALIALIVSRWSNRRWIAEGALVGIVLLLMLFPILRGLAAFSCNKSWIGGPW
jgi:hypothetical protein